MPMFKKTLTTVSASLAMASLLSVGALAQSPEEFYADNTLRFMSTTGAGGTMDLYLLLTMKHIEKHLPDGAEVVLEHRTGGGGATGANYLFQAAPQDGSIIGMPVPAIVSSGFSNPNQIRYQADEFQSVGRIVDLPRIYVGRADAGLETLEDAVGTAEPITHSIMTVGTSLDQYMTVANQAVGTNFRSVAGYSGGGPAFLAMEQGETQSTTAEPANLFSNKWHLVEDGTINVLAVGGIERMEQIPEVPHLLELIDEDNDYYDVANAVMSQGAIGLSLIAPPGVPQDRMDFLREAFMNTMNDPEFIAEAEERDIPVNPADGVWLDELIAESANVSEDVRQWFFDMANQ